MLRAGPASGFGVFWSMAARGDSANGPYPESQKAGRHPRRATNPKEQEGSRRPRHGAAAAAEDPGKGPAVAAYSQAKQGLRPVKHRWDRVGGSSAALRPSASNRGKSENQMLTSILVHIEPADISRSRLECAAQVARRFDAKLIGLAASQLREPVVDSYGGVAMAVDMEAEGERIRTEFQNAENAFRNSPAVDGLQIEWRSAIGLPAEVVVRESRAADIVVLGGSPSLLGPYRSVDPGDVLMRAGRPVLVLPDGAKKLDAKHIVVGWKDTREARRACLDALPVLRAADLVSIVEVVDQSEIEAAKARVTDVATFLGRHDVQAEAEPCVRAERSVADALILAADQRGADLIVAGAYGHTRLREWIFGGVTADLLTRSPKYSLLAH